MDSPSSSLVKIRPADSSTTVRAGRKLLPNLDVDQLVVLIAALHVPIHEHISPALASCSPSGDWDIPKE
jgi:hypothetical protein